MTDDSRKQFTKLEMPTATGVAIIITPYTISSEDLEKLKKYLESLKKDK